MSSRAASRVRRLLSAASALALAAAAVLLGGAPAHAAGGGYYDGSIRYSQIVNCVSIIQSSPYTEYGAGAYVGGYADPDSGVPYVGQSFYVHVVVAGVGNACSGQRFVPGFALPAGVSLQPSLPILCFAGGQPATGDADCPQWGNVLSNAFGGGTFGYLSSDSEHANMWPLPQGAMWEFQFPVIASSTQSGSTLQGIVRMADGNGNPDLTPSAPLYVFASAGTGATQVIYKQPSTRAGSTVPNLNTPSATGLYSEATVYTQVNGTIRLQRGTSPGVYTEQQDFAVTHTAGNYGWVLDTDWAGDAYFAPLASGATYYWRVGFLPTSGSTVWGAEQSFSYPLGASSNTLSGGNPTTAPVVNPGNAAAAAAAAGTTPAGGGSPSGTTPGVTAPPASPAAPATCHGKAVTVDLAKGQKPTKKADVILGTGKKDVIRALAGNDVICGGGGNDVIDPGSGNDWVDGGAGSDTVSFATATTGVTLSLASTKRQRTGGSGTDTVVNVENVTGSPRADRLSGSKRANVISGGGGADRLSASAGNDTLIGGAGRDVCSGGAGKDRARSCEVRSSVP